jgi:hypothetical protein
MTNHCMEQSWYPLCPPYICSPCLFCLYVLPLLTTSFQHYFLVIPLLTLLLANLSAHTAFLCKSEDCSPFLLLPLQMDREHRASVAISLLFVLLAFITTTTAIEHLAASSEPDDTNVSIQICLCCPLSTRISEPIHSAGPIRPVHNLCGGPRYTWRYQALVCFCCFFRMTTNKTNASLRGPIKIQMRRLASKLDSKSLKKDGVCTIAGTS